MSQITNTYNELKHDFRINADLQTQFEETERQRRIQQMMLAKHFQHQKKILKQRHTELLKLKQEIQNIQSYEHNQIKNEDKLKQRHQQIMKIQNNFNKRKAKINDNRQLLEQRKKSILDEMQKFNQLTQSMSKLNLNAADLTQQQKNELDDFITKHPETMNDDYSYNNFIQFNNYHKFRNSLQNDFDSSDDDNLMDQYSNKYSRKSRKRKYRQTRKRSIRREREKHSRKSRKGRDLTRSQSPVIRCKSRKRKSKQSNRMSLKKFFKRKSKSQTSSHRSTSNKQKMKREISSQSGNLYVRLVNARHVFGHKGSKINTYVELQCNDQIHTSSIKSSRNPEWNEFFKFYVNDYNKDLLIVRLIDNKTEKSIAKMKIPIHKFVDQQHNKQDYLMNDELSMSLDIGYGDKSGCDIMRESYLVSKE